MRSVLEGVWLGVTKAPQRFLGVWFIAFSVGWTLVESALGLLGTERFHGVGLYVGLASLSLVVALIRGRRPSKVTFRPKTTNLELSVGFGDLFAVPGLKIIPVNDFFDCELGDLVSPRSLHGQLITRYFGGHPEALDARVREGLRSHQGTRVERAAGRDHRYPIGTTIMVTTREERFLLVALARSDIRTHKAQAGPQELWAALSSAWNHARLVAGGEPIAVPLIGGGLSGVGLPPQHLLQILVLSLITATKSQPVTGRVQVVLPVDLLDAVDLEPLKKEWE